MITLYIREPGALVRRSHSRLIVEKDGTVLQSVRLRDVERVVLIGNATLTAPAAQALLEAGVETALLSRGGRFLGRLAPAESRNVLLRREQFQRAGDVEFRLPVARAIVRGKLRNARQLLLRHERNHPGGAVRTEAAGRLERRLGRLETAATLDALRGMEGDAAREYFAALGTMVRAEFEFTGRSRRPPRDPVNALLSFAYTLLTTELTGAAAAQGLDPQVGCALHDLHYGRPSLALDLVEEFRTPVADRLALSLVNRSILRSEHFESPGSPPGAVLLNDTGRRVFLPFYHQAVETEFEDRASGGRTTYRELFRRQAARMRETIEHGTDYVPFAAR